MRLSYIIPVLCVLALADAKPADKQQAKREEKEQEECGLNEHNVLWILLDDISTERFPESGNEALDGKLPGFKQLKDDGAVYYPHFYSPSSVCAPSQVALFSGMEPGNIGGQYQFAGDSLPGKAPYNTVPPPDVKFLPERLRELGYWSTGAGKLDYQVAEVVPTFYNKITGGFLSDTTSNTILGNVWNPALEQDRPWFGMLNLMDHHQFVTSMQREAPIPITNPETGAPATELPFGQFGYSLPNAMIYKNGPDGAEFSAPAVTVDYEGETDIVGYRGDLDENNLTHANGGVPGYLPEHIGIKSVLAKEYDLVRNVDYRLQKIIAKLKADGIYDNTLIMVFGDHGSGLFKGKLLLQPQSVRTPLWIKYPVDTKLPDAVTTNADNHKVDERMAAITDLYPTTLSVVGVEPDSYLEGRALAGDFLDTRPERDTMFALLQRVGSKQAWKTFSAFTKEFYYQENWLNEDAIAERAELDIEGEIAMLTDALDDSTYRSHTNFFATAPLFEQLKKLMRLNAFNTSYDEKYNQLTADDQRPPPHVFFDLRSDSYGTDNLLYDYTYTVETSAIVQKWGNTISKVTVEYGAVDESILDADQAAGLAKLRSALPEWIATQAWVSNEIDWSDALFGEENTMGETFWPGGVQPQTANPTFDAPLTNRDDDDSAIVKLQSVTDGAVTRYAAVTTEGLVPCEQIGADIKASLAEMDITNSGLPVVSYTSKRNSLTYTGFQYGSGFGRDVVLSWFIGQAGCNIFVSVDATFMEIDCEALGNIFVFDTRDSTWDGDEWVGVNTDGTWSGTPATFWDSDAKQLNYGAFNEYVFGAKRDQVYSGLNPDGSPFTTPFPQFTPLNKGVNPAPSYFACPDEDVTQPPAPQYPISAFNPIGWELSPSLSFFNNVNTDGLNNIGSFRLSVTQRTSPPNRLDTLNIEFQSFNYECLLWGVGSTVAAPAAEGQTSHVFAQAIRKGFADSTIVEYTFTPSDVRSKKSKKSKCKSKKTK